MESNQKDKSEIDKSGNYCDFNMEIKLEEHPIKIESEYEIVSDVNYSEMAVKQEMDASTKNFDYLMDMNVEESLLDVKIEDHPIEEELKQISGPSSEQSFPCISHHSISYESLPIVKLQSGEQQYQCIYCNKSFCLKKCMVQLEKIHNEKNILLFKNYLS